jgi:hypothetical protein
VVGVGDQGVASAAGVVIGVVVIGGRGESGSGRVVGVVVVGVFRRWVWGVVCGVVEVEVGVGTSKWVTRLVDGCWGCGCGCLCLCSEGMDREGNLGGGLAWVEGRTA